MAFLSGLFIPIQTTLPVRSRGRILINALDGFFIMEEYSFERVLKEMSPDKRQLVELYRKGGKICYYVNKEGKVARYKEHFGDELARRNGWEKVDPVEGKKLMAQQNALKKKLSAERRAHKLAQNAVKPKPLPKRPNRSF